MASIFESPEMIGAFIAEVEEQLQMLENSIISLEQNGETEEHVHELFRIAHTLKGCSATMGFEKMKNLAHELENVLDSIRNGFLKISGPVTDVLFDCLDCLRMLKDDYVSDANNIKTDINPVINKLKAITASENKQEDNPDKAGNAEVEHSKSVIFALDTKQREQINHALEIGQNVLVCEISISEDSQMKSTRACLIMNFLNEWGTVVSMVPNVLEVPVDSDICNVAFLVITQMSAAALEHKARNDLMDVSDVKVFPYSVDTAEHVIKAYETETRDMDNASCAKTPGDEKKIVHTVRIDVDRLERMMELVGELVIEQIRIAQVANSLYNRYRSDETVDDLVVISNNISVLINELREKIIKTRMIPIQQLFSRFPRMVRDLSRSLNKEVNLVLEGEETEIDRTIMEEMSDPLIHLIRNAIDHGIEEPEVRRRLGKPEKGTLRITAFHHDSNVIITVEDDGAGIDIQKIKEAAVKKRLVTAQEADSMTEQQLINLIFHSGFSTSQTVSDISGRGVGLDIVKSHVEKLNGIIDVETCAGAGTRFIIKLPFTLAILKGLLVKIGDETYAIPMNNVIEIVRKTNNEIESVNGQAITVIRDKAIPLVWLHDYFGIPRGEEKRNVLVVLLGIAERHFGLVVDGLIGNQEIVVTNLGSYIGKVEGISGATILGDRSVACILDVAGILDMISKKRAAKIHNKQTEN
ncbi:chemotaxis protein CheA [Thermoclostridium stercorarium subsp. stercorarium DSM 8532]|uniref:Chemotaxis protein CheA n=2 Tax=Thermoclostridium stercorarium TaxID=1510 RepID=L7VKV8_THES1|nr:chemotaxis protein CheA [Thermoclostridium stercorarium]AGC68770.1 chemotaxis protein CheA [Thermoclostridium stercorarium subsp. stercorarium DSM 8532]AGI39776.1 chemotaxis protein [Thermoclostridium stercorarium subsp. stercorarium DSM 8532]ANW99090.1 chemotaxis protein CheA [Thermoclostridium stercorarium subsp. thermolacticum DSM 2910]